MKKTLIQQNWLFSRGKELFNPPRNVSREWKPGENTQQPPSDSGVPRVGGGSNHPELPKFRQS
jgi:hypothetical protein